MVTWKDKLNIRLGIFLLLLGTSSLLTLGFTHSNFIHSSASLNYLKFNNSCLINKDQYLYLGKKTFLNDVEKKISLEKVNRNKIKMRKVVRLPTPARIFCGNFTDTIVA